MPLENSVLNEEECEKEECLECLFQQKQPAVRACVCAAAAADGGEPPRKKHLKTEREKKKA